MTRVDNKDFTDTVLLADKLRDEKRCSEAANLYARAAKMAPERIDIKIQQANMLKDSGQTKNAIGIYKEVLNFERSADTLLQLARALKLSKNFMDSLSAYRESLALDAGELCSVIENEMDQIRKEENISEKIKLLEEKISYIGKGDVVGFLSINSINANSFLVSLFTREAEIIELEISGDGLDNEIKFLIPLPSSAFDGEAHWLSLQLSDGASSMMLERGTATAMPVEVPRSGRQILAIVNDQPHTLLPKDQRVRGMPISSLKLGDQQVAFDFENRLQMTGGQQLLVRQVALAQADTAEIAPDRYLLEIPRLPAAPRGVAAADASGFGIIDAPPDLPVPAAPPQEAARAEGGRATVLCDGLRVLTAAGADAVGARAETLRGFVTLSGRDPAAGLLRLAADLEAGPLPDRGGTDPDDLPHPGDCAFEEAVRDLWYAAQTSLTVSLAELETLFSGRARRLRAFQFDPALDGRLGCVADVKCGASDLDFVQLDLLSHWHPILLELSDAADLTLGVVILPFPSLARGGLHHCEVVAGVGGSFPANAVLSCMDQFRRAAGHARPTVQVAVHLDGATGGETIFQPSLRHWLWGFGLSVTALPSGTAADADLLAATGLSVAADAQRTIAIPADAIPTVAAVCGAAFAPSGVAPGVRLPAPFLVAERGTGRPRWSVALPADPALVDWQDRIGPAGYPVVSGLGQPATAVAVRLPVDGDSRLPLDHLCTPPLDVPPPAAAAAGQMLCVLEVDDPAQAARCLAVLGAQNGAGRLRVVLRIPPRLAAERARLMALLQGFGPQNDDVVVTAGRGLPVAWLMSVSQGFAAVALLSDRVILHDPQTLETLHQILAETGAASVAPMVLFEDVAARATSISHAESGYYPARIHLGVGPRLVLTTSQGTLEALPDSIIPVLANTGAAVVLSRLALAECGLAILDLASFGLATTARGLRNLCLTALRATTVRRPPAPEVMDPLGVRTIDPGDWGVLLSRVTRIEEIR